MDKNKLELFSKEEVENTVKDLLNRESYKSVQSRENPVGIALGGIAGSGKGKLGEIEASKLPDLYKVIGDDYRELHPRYNELVEAFGHTRIAEKTQKFSAEVIKSIIPEVLAAKKNLLVEGTFRIAENPINLLKDMKANGYTTKVQLLITSREVAWDSTIQRYQNALTAKQPARTVDKEYFRKTVAGLPKNAQEILDAKVADSFVITKRQNNKLNEIFEYKEIVDLKKSSPQKIERIVKLELNRKATQEEKQIMAKTKNMSRR